MHEHFRPEIAEHHLNRLFLKLFDSPSETSYSERATIASFSLDANVELGRAIAKQLVDLTSLAKAYEEDKTPESVLTLLKSLTNYLQVFLYDQESKKKPSLGKDWEKYLQRAESFKLPKEFSEQMHHLLTEVLADYKADGVIGLAELLQDREMIPVFPDLDREHRQFQKEPLLKNLDNIIEPTELDTDVRCALSIVFIKDDRYPQYKLRVPSFFLKSLFQFHRMDLARWPWIDVDAQPIRQLAMLGGNNRENFRFQHMNKIVNAIKRLEHNHGLIVRGDGMIFRAN